MAPVDDAIAKARAERKKTMEQGYVTADSTPDTQLGQPSYTPQSTYRIPSIMEQLEKSADYHFDQHTRSQQGASFLKAHPEFEEFLRLFRMGIFPVIVLLLCAVAVLAQKATPPPAPSPASPTLSTAERTALQALEKQKQEAQQNFTQAQQAEAVIEREFLGEHAGFHINPQTFVVEENSTRTAAPARTPALVHRPTPPPAK